MQRSGLILFFIFFVQTSYVKASELTLDAAIDLALQYNFKISLANIDTTLQDKAILVEREKFKPMVNIASKLQYKSLSSSSSSLTSSSTIPELMIVPELSLTTVLGTKISLSAEQYYRRLNLHFKQPLFNGAGTLVNKLALHQALVNKKIQQLIFKDTISSVIKDVIVQYHKLQKMQMELNIAAQNLSNMRLMSQKFKALVVAGRMASVDLEQVNANVLNQENTLVAQEYNYSAAMAEFYNLLGVKVADKPVVLAEFVATKNILLSNDQYIELFFLHDPSYNIFLLNKTQGQIAIKAAENQQLLALNLDLGSAISIDRTNPIPNELSIGVSLEIPFGHSATRSYPMDLAVANLNKIHIELNQMQRQLRNDLLNLLQEIKLKERQLVLYDKSIELAELNLANAKKKLEFGRVAIFELLALNQQLLQTKLDKIALQISYEDLIIELKYRIGESLPGVSNEARA